VKLKLLIIAIYSGSSYIALTAAVFIDALKLGRLTAKSAEIAQPAQQTIERHTRRQAVMRCGFDENLTRSGQCKSSINTHEIRTVVLMKICSKAHGAKGSVLQTKSARVCGRFCSETSHVAAVHGLRTSSSRDQRKPNLI
jgi:hypothetical protein